MEIQYTALKEEFKADLLDLWIDIREKHQAEFEALADELSALMIRAIKANETDLFPRIKKQADAIAEIKGGAISKATLNQIIKWAMMIVKYTLMAM